ncbi:hypothetical protein Tsp_02939 [Trichinella spiralis]|uniref:hypothetical protein n=1 Tax=Trichinella spiralis TaxID=6334 RepID=UPI0001EFCF87|nr:hypothetical protein Tsp_02939 [Trichinella spiralis]
MQFSIIIRALLLLYVGATMRDKEKQSFAEQILEDRVGGLNTLNELLVDYNYHIRPSVDKNLPLQINVSIHVLNVEWKADKLTLLYSICQSWNDDRLIFKTSFTYLISTTTIFLIASVAKRKFYQAIVKQLLRQS